MDFAFPCTIPDLLSPGLARPATMAQLLQAMETLKFEPIVTLAEVIEQLGLLDRAAIGALMSEDPELFRGRSPDLVRRVLLTSEDYYRALARVAGIVEVDAASFELPASAFDLLPLRVLRARDMLFLGEADEMLIVASWFPTSEDLHGYLCALTGRSVRMVWAERDAISARLDRLDPHAPLHSPGHANQKAPGDAKVSGQAPLAGGRLPPEEQDMEYLMAEAVRDMASGLEVEEATEANESSSMVRMVKRLIMDAQALRASDIHIETNPGEQFTSIRLRRDGDLELYQKLPPPLRAAMVSRIKVMAKLDIAERRRPQDGKINFSEFGGDQLELRVAIMPTHDGMEDVVMRLLASTLPVPLAQLGLQHAISMG